ncbi:MAG: two-component system cell cycle sensor histidine kinase/response regulator CckA [Candidatus Azotimanducaceae bacterium]|jgi:two-component system cell cycle sensor histidine kinase/response regulator CckA
MDKLGDHRKSAKVSCRNISWYFDLCIEKKLDCTSILRNVKYSKAYLQDPGNFIDWQSFAVINNNLRQYLSDEEIREAGRLSWNNISFRHSKNVSSVKNSALSQFQTIFGSVGVIAKLYPCELSISESSLNHFVIHLRMKNELASCRSFHLILVGQMIGLPEISGQGAASVELQHNKTGADFNVHHSDGFSFLYLFKQFFSQWRDRETIESELNLHYDTLDAKYRQLYLANKKFTENQSENSEISIRYELLSRNVNDVIWMCDLQLNLQYLSPSFEDLTGFEISEGIKKPLSQFLTDKPIEIISKGLKTALSGIKAIRSEIIFETQMTRKNNSTVWTEVEVKFEFDRNDSPIRVIGQTKDISERKLLEAMLNRSEKKYGLIANSARDAIITFNEHGHITFANPSASRIFDYSLNDLVALPIKLIIPDIFRASPHEIDQLTEANIQLSGQTKHNQSLSLEVSFVQTEIDSQTLYTAIARDIGQRERHNEERKDLQNQLLASQKLESIGQLTGGIAHDFNNLLVAINGYADLGINRGNKDSEVNHYFAEIKRAGKSAALMTQKLLAFSRKQTPEPTISNFPSLLLSLHPMIQRLLPKNIVVTFDIEDSNLNVPIDSSQLEQIIVNLTVNARDAMPEGGELKISCRHEWLDDSSICTHSLAVGSYSIVTVSDSGQGMSMNTRNRIFEPFFTTKPIGSGTGLGLAVVHGIVSEHKGLIQIDSELGKGTVFILYLPSSEKSLGTQISYDATCDLRGSESILIVEDNAQVRELVSILLKGIGYSVQSAIDGQDAWEYYKFHNDNIDLVIMDVVMPRMGGREVYKRIREVNPYVKVIFTSGYAIDGLHTKFIHENQLEFIQKPYHTELLKVRIRKVLDEHTKSIPAQKQS